MKGFMPFVVMLLYVNSLIAQNGTIKAFTVNGVSFEMVYVEGGQYTIGEASSAETNVNDFLIGKTEVTQELWKAVTGKNPSSMRGKEKPVETVSWNDCQEFLQKLSQLTGQNFRLPTENEWEYAARGGNKATGCKFSGSNVMGKVGWYSGNSDNQTHPVASKMPNELGIFDMSGNLWEWCSDIYQGVDNLQYVIRGGCFTDATQICTITNRGKSDPATASDICGLRLAMDK